MYKPLLMKICGKTVAIIKLVRPLPAGGVTVPRPIGASIIRAAALARSSRPG